jgi:hypothetical protein
MKDELIGLAAFLLICILCMALFSLNSIGYR